MVPKSPKHLIIDPLSKFGEEEIEQYPGLRAIATPSTGRDHIDLDACEKAGIEVYGLTDDREALEEIRASSEFTFLCILMGLRRIDRLIGSTDRREPTHELYNKRVGIVGMGRIGSNVARWCAAFDATVDFHDPYKAGYSLSLEELFAECDVVCITCSLTKETTHMIDRPLLESMKKDAVLVNTSRGAVINEYDLVDVLRIRPDLTAVLDVLTGELDKSHIKSPLWFMKNVILTPHVADHTHESIEKARDIAERLLYTSNDEPKQE